MGVVMSPIPTSLIQLDCKAVIFLFSDAIVKYLGEEKGLFG